MSTATTTKASSALRNVAIIAHVDHGKTSLVDKLLYQSGMFRAEALDKLSGGQHGLIMDSNDIERERGITILSKNCAVTYSDEDGTETRINIIDTPGHADFGGEVERVLRMADGCLLLVDAFEGPMPQTRFVLSKAIEAGLAPVVVVNKCDRPDGEPQRVVNEVFDLLIDLDAEEHALDFPVVYASAKQGWATRDAEEIDDLVAEAKQGDLRAAFDAIIEHVPPAGGDAEAPLQLLITTLGYSEYTGRIGIGRIFRGSARAGDAVTLIARDGTSRNAKLAGLQMFEGLSRRDTDIVSAGDLCAITGIDPIDIGDTVASPEDPTPLPPVTIDEPTLEMVFRVNDSPFAGKEGEFVTSRQVGSRLQKEAQTDVALRITTGGSGEEFAVAGRGLLHLGILMENMRREGFEFQVGKPHVVEKVINGQVHEPVEELVVEAPTEHIGAAMELVGSRRGEVKNIEHHNDYAKLIFEIPARGLVGLRSRLLNATQGKATMHHAFQRFDPKSGEIPARTAGVLIASESGAVTAYSIDALSDRGSLFVVPGQEVYAGQIIGEHNRDNDLTVNITRAKQLTNFREATKDAFTKLKAARDMSLEVSLEYIEDDELVEVTPTSVRVRKRMLSETERKKADRAAKNAAAGKT